MERAEVLLDLRVFRRALSDLEFLADAPAARCSSGERHSTAPQTLDILGLGCAAMRRVPVVPASVGLPGADASAARLGAVGVVDGCPAGMVHLYGAVQQNPHLLQRLVIASVAVLRHSGELPDGVLERVVLLLVRAYRTLGEYALWTVRFVPVYVAIVLPLLEAQLHGSATMLRAPPVTRRPATSVRSRLTVAARLLACSLCDELNAVYQDAMCEWESHDQRFSTPLVVLAKTVPVDAAYAEARCKLLLLDRAVRPHGVGTLVALGFPLSSVVPVGEQRARRADVVVRELDAVSALYFALRTDERPQAGAEAFCAVRDGLPALFEIWSARGAHGSMTPVLESTIWELATSCACAFSSESRLAELLSTLLPPLLQFAASLVEGSTASADLLFLRLFEAVRLAVEVRVDLLAFCQRTIPNLIGAVRIVRGKYVDVEFAPKPQSSFTADGSCECMPAEPQRPRLRAPRDQILVALFEFLAVCLRSPDVEEGHRDTTAVLQAMGFYSIVQFARNHIDDIGERTGAVGDREDRPRTEEDDEAADELFVGALRVGIEGARQQRDLKFLFGEVLPRVVGKCRLACCASRERRLSVVVRLLELGALCLRQGMHPTQSFANRIVDVISECGLPGKFDPNLQIALLEDAQASVLHCLEKRLKVSVLLVTGIPLLVQLLAHSGDALTIDSTLHCFKDHVDRVVRHFCGQNIATGSPLLTLDAAWTFLHGCLDDSERPSAAKLALRLAFIGRRDEIRALHSVCNNPLESGDFRVLREELFRYSQKSFVSVCHLTRTILDFRARRTGGVGAQWIADAVLASACDYMRRESNLSSAVLRRLQHTIERGAFCCVVFANELQKVSDASSVLAASSSGAGVVTASLADCMLAEMDKLFAPEVLADDVVMDAVGLVGHRLHMLAHEPARLPLVECAARGLRVLCGRREMGGDEHEASVKCCGVTPSTCSGSSVSRERVALMQAYFFGLERNRAVISALEECGFSAWLWELGSSSELHHVDVVLGDVEVIEASFRKAVVEECYEQYAVLLAKCGIHSILLSGETVAMRCSDVFDAKLCLGLDELKSRRAQCARAVDAGRALRPSEQSAEIGREIGVLVCRESELERNMEDEISLLEKELLEIDAVGALRMSQRTHACRAVVRKGLLDCVTSCSGSVEGCYQPSGVHVEKPIEIGVRADAMIWSVEDVSSGQEIENVEVLLCREGAYVFRAYTSGHLLCTSSVWLHLFRNLLARGHVPRIILPPDAPTRHLFRLLLDRVGPAVANSPLTFDFDFAEECGGCLVAGGGGDGAAGAAGAAAGGGEGGGVQQAPYRSYYDSRPDAIEAGKDVVLTFEALEHGFFAFPRVLEVGVLLSGELKSAAELRDRPESRGERDLDAYLTRRDWVGLLLARTLDSMRRDPVLKPFVVLGRGIAQYVSAFVDSGAALAHLNRVLEMEIDVERWNRSRSVQQPRGGGSGRRQRRAGDRAGVCVEGPALTVEGKHETVKRVVATVLSVCTDYMTQTDFARLLGCNATHFWAARDFLRRRAALAAESVERRADADDDEEVEEGEEDGLGPLLRGRELLRGLDDVLWSSLEFVYVHELPEELQVAAMQAVFRNEDRVWRRRGGRPSHETVDDFVRFVRSNGERTGRVVGVNPVGGVLVVNYRRLEALTGSFAAVAPAIDARIEALGRMLRSGEVLGYAVGEFVSEQPSEQQQQQRRRRQAGAVGYEIVTAWVYPQLCHVGVATTMYRRLLAVLLAVPLPRVRAVWHQQQCGGGSMPVARGHCRFVRVDVVRGAWSRVTAASWLGRLKLWGLCAASPSYSTAVAGSEGRRGSVEQFEGRDVALYPILACDVLLYAAGAWLVFVMRSLRRNKRRAAVVTRAPSRPAAPPEAGGKLKTL